jgi:DNA-binding LytR/AlgR family response regulator
MEKCDVLIVEDEVVIAEAIAEILTVSGYNDIYISDSVENALATIEKCRPKIVLTDINLGSEKSGIDLGHQLLYRYRIPFIYITSYSGAEIVAKAKHTRPSAYIIKPFKNEDLLVAIELALFNSDNKFIPLQEDQCFTIQEGKAMTSLPIKNIMWFETTGGFTTIKVPNGRKRVLRYPISELEKQFSNKTFLRIHDSYIINCNYVTETRKNSIIVNGNELPVGADYQNRVYSYFNC